MEWAFTLRAEAGEGAGLCLSALHHPKLRRGRGVSREGGVLLLRLFAKQKQGEGGIAGLKMLQMCQLFCGLQQCLLRGLHSVQSQPKSELEPCPSATPSAEKGTG